jgi:hypothetical protein
MSNDLFPLDYTHTHTHTHTLLWALCEPITNALKEASTEPPISLSSSPHYKKFLSSFGFLLTGASSLLAEARAELLWSHGPRWEK